MFAVVPEQGVVANFAYRYPSRAAASSAANVLRKDVEAAPNLLDVKMLKGGRGYLLKGDEGDIVFWFIGTKNNSLSLVLVNGMNEKEATALFDSAIRQVSDQLIDPVSDLK